MIISLSYLIVSLHQKSLQNHKKSTIFNIFRIQKHIHAGYVNEKHPGPVHELSLCSFHMLDYFQNAKMMIFDDFFGFFLFLSFSTKKMMIFFSFHNIEICTQAVIFMILCNHDVQLLYQPAHNKCGSDRTPKKSHGV